MVIVVSPVIEWTNQNGGGIEADFDTGDFEVMCPFVQLHITPFIFFTLSFSHFDPYRNSA